MVKEPDPEQKLRLVAAQSRRVKARSGGLLQMIRTAASAESELADLWASIEAKLLDVQRAIIEQLHSTGSLAPSLNVSRATDILWTLNHPNVWQLWSRTAAGLTRSMSNGSATPSAPNSSTTPQRDTPADPRKHVPVRPLPHRATHPPLEPGDTAET